MTVHNIPPVYNKNSTILILGSFPSVKSRAGMFFYNHPQNRFWKVISAVFDKTCPQSINEKKEFLLSNGIAVWDVIKSCDITGSDDNSIKNVTPNDINEILDASSITRIFTNGAAAHKLYCRYLFEQTQIEAVKLPSTSPANAAWSLDRLINEWSGKIIR